MASICGWAGAAIVGNNAQWPFDMKSLPPASRTAPLSGSLQNAGQTYLARRSMTRSDLQVEAVRLPPKFPQLQELVRASRPASRAVS